MRDTSVLRHYRAEVAGYGQPITSTAPRKRLSRVTRARRRVTTMSKSIRTSIANAIVASVRERRAGLGLEGTWKWWEHHLKDRVRDLVREARIANDVEGPR